MYRNKHLKKQKVSVHNVMYRTVGILIVLTLFSTWLLYGFYAKYTVSGDTGDSARVAKGVDIKVLEHEVELITDKTEAVENDRVYKLNEKNEVEKFTYSVVLPGVDLPKDPFIKIEGVPEVTYELYITVDDSKLPDTVTYEIDTEKWTEPPEGSKTYKYKGVIDSNFDGKKIYILKNNEIKVSEKYSETNFSLAFEAKLVQID